jgi:hypothetical protein
MPGLHGEIWHASVFELRSTVRHEASRLPSHDEVLYLELSSWQSAMCYNVILRPGLKQMGGRHGIFFPFF